MTSNYNSQFQCHTMNCNTCGQSYIKYPGGDNAECIYCGSDICKKCAKPLSPESFCCKQNSRCDYKYMFICGPCKEDSVTDEQARQMLELLIAQGAKLDPTVSMEALREQFRVQGKMEQVNRNCPDCDAPPFYEEDCEDV